MNVLITSAASPLAHHVARGLYAAHDVRLTDIRDARGPWPFVRCDLGHDEATDRLVAGVDVLIHLALPPPGLADESETAANELIDYHTRRTYNLLLAASEAGVSRCIYASSLSIFANCEEDWAINERWRPRPSTEPHILSHHLGEFTCREFAREGRIAITCLRLGNLGNPGEQAAQPPDPTWLALEDAVHAFQCALAAPAEPWAIYHIQSAFPEARFGAGKARDGIGFAPRSGAGGAG